MAQAKRKRGAARTGGSFSLSGHGLGMLLAGIAIGSLGTVLWQGMQSRDSDVGSGIRQMIETSRQQAETQAVTQSEPEIKPEPQSTNYDFFTVLPEIEVVVTDDEEPVSPPKLAESESQPTATNQSPEAATPTVSEINPKPVGASTSSAYMLQAGSYNSPTDAERQKANLALMGLPSTIQKITIQGRGDFYRVRLGPYVNHAQMVDVDERLRDEGIKALRLKISRSG